MPKNTITEVETNESEQSQETLTPEQRARIISDICSLTREYRYHANRWFKDTDTQNIIDSHSEMPTDELYDFWCSYVGEWLASRHDMPPRDSKFEPDEFEAWLDSQWAALLSDESRDYGFVLAVKIEPEQVTEIA